jgi:hypothetical protein
MLFSFFLMSITPSLSFASEGIIDPTTNNTDWSSKTPSIKELKSYFPTREKLKKAKKRIKKLQKTNRRAERKNELKTQKEIEVLLQAIKNIDPQKANPLAVEKSGGDALSFSQEDLDISISIDSSSILLDTDGISLGIGIPISQSTLDAQSGSANIQGKSITVVDNQAIIFTDDADIILQSVEGGVRSILSINSTHSHKSYDFPLDLPKGFSLEKKKDGSVNIKDENNTLHTTILKPWARDAKGREVETYYTIKGSTLTQYVDFNAEHAFPVIADPWWCSKTVKSVRWIDRGGEWSASVSPTSCGKWVSYWGEVYSKIPYHDVWYKHWWSHDTYWSVRNQWRCHIEFAGPLKTPWNLEPHRPNVGYWDTVFSKCNP